MSGKREQYVIVKSPLESDVGHSIASFNQHYAIIPRSIKYWENRHWNLERRQVVDTLFLVIVHGRLAYQIGDRSGEAGAGTVLVIPPHTDHELQHIVPRHASGNDARLHQFALHADIDDRAGQPWAKQAIAQWDNAALQLPHGDEHTSSWHRICALSEHQPDAGRHLLVGDIRRLIAALYVHHGAWRTIHAPNTDQRIQHVISVLLNDIARDWTVGDMADLAGLGEVQFRNHFHRDYGCSPWQWLLQRRIQTACHALHGTTDTIRTIANSVGFTDADYFRRVFKQRLGCTPSAWRSRHDV